MCKISSSNNIKIEELYNKYYATILKRALYLTRDKYLAEDITQETMVKIIRALNKGNEHLSKPWYVYNIATNVYIDHFNSNKNTTIDSELADRSLEIDEPTQEDLVFMDQILGFLSPELRAMAIYACIDQFTVREIANITGMSERSVLRRLKRIKDRLRMHLKGLWNQSRTFQAENSLFPEAEESMEITSH